MEGRNTLTMLVLLTTILYSCSATHYKQSSSHPDLYQANHFIEQGKWILAIGEFEEYLSQYPENHLVRLQLGRSLLVDNRIDEALAEFNTIIEKDTNIPGEAYFWAGRSSHMLNRFTEAETFYRQYAEYDENPDLELLSYFLKQLGAAKKAGTEVTQYIIENVGNQVNSDLNEFRPVYSPNIDQRFYFSTQDPAYSSNTQISVVKNPSMSFAEINNGIWITGGALDPDLAGDAEFHLLDFSTDGQRVYFSRPEDNGVRVTYQKNFDNIPGQPPVSQWQHPVFNTSLGDRDLFTINDSAFLFSSNRLNGLGGYDIFVTFQRMGEWLVQNLGPVINSPYDEISPFLSNDGRELYFSSNSDLSIGGYDIFFATFDDDMETWTPPHNMLSPLNTGQNEVGFRLSKDGQHALFASDQTGGYGGFDIYHVYFYKQRTSQTRVRNPGSFFQVHAFRSFASEGRNSQILSEKPVYNLPVISYGERPVVMTSHIKQELDRVLEYGKLFPHTGLLLHIFSKKKTQDLFSLYRPVLILKKVIDYLKEGGLDPARLELRLFGNQYPRFRDGSSLSNHAITPATASNQRLELEFTNTENLPIQFGVPISAMSDDEPGLSPYQKWKLQTQKLYFRIELLSTDQLIKGTNYAQIEDLMLLISENGELYTYYGGIFQNIKDAKQGLSKYYAKGFMDAQIVAFIDHKKITGDQITANMINSYPELKEYIIYQK